MFRYNVSGALRNLVKPNRDAVAEENEKIMRRQQEIVRVSAYKKVFSSPEGQLVLDDIRKCSRNNFPNYENVYATYSKIGEQAIVDYIDASIKKADFIRK